MINHEDYSGGVELTISLCLVYTICIACVRLWIRRNAFGLDDIVVGVATLIAFGHTAADYAALADGLGAPFRVVSRRRKVPQLEASSIAGIVTFTLAVYLSKCAMLAFLSRITKKRPQIMLYHICSAAVAAIGLVSIVVVLAGCRPASGYYWAFFTNASTGCPNQSVRWQAFLALDILTEVLLLLLPIELTWNLQMPRKKKVMIIAAFYLRLPVVALSLARNHYTLLLRHPSTDPGLTSGIVTIWLEVQLAYALAASTLSASKAFTENFNSGFGLGFARGKGEDICSYGLPGVVSGSSGTPGGSRARNSRTSSPGGSRWSGMLAPEKTPGVGGHPVASSPLRFEGATEQGQVGCRRDEAAVENFAEVGVPPEGETWQENDREESKNAMDDMVIVRGMGRHDR